MKGDLLIEFLMAGVLALPILHRSIPAHETLMTDASGLTRWDCTPTDKPVAGMTYRPSSKSAATLPQFVPHPSTIFTETTALNAPVASLLSGMK